jgi:hypothetical protein
MKLKLTKKGKIILFAILGVVVLGSGGFLLWRVLQDDTVAPEDSEAAPVEVKEVGDDKVHIFRSNGTFELEYEAEVTYLVVGGGGGGGGSTGGGGGAGGFLTGKVTKPAGSYPVVVGVGGAAGTRSPNSPGNNGGNSSIFGITAKGGGGGGGSGDGTFPKVGGSGGGSGARWTTDDGASTTPGANGTSGQGNRGGDSYRFTAYNPSFGGGGGGGAGGAGAKAFHSEGTIKGGNGGIGKSSSISGSTQWYAGGGGGGSYGTGGQGGGGSATKAGVTNTGGGGGGGNRSNGGRGGSGIVIVRYKKAEIPDPKCGSFHNKEYSEGDNTWGVGEFCEVGTASPESPTFPTPGGRTDWKCISGSKEVDCTARRSDIEESPQCREVCTTDPDNCPTGLECQDSVCVNPDCPSEDDCICPTAECGDGILSEGEQCELGNPTGYQCIWDECNQSTCICPDEPEPENPDWSISKTGVGECIVQNEETYAKGTYTITVTNVGEGEGSIDKIEDLLDEKVLETYLNEISNSGIYESGVITWDLEGDDEIFSPEESLQLTYYVLVPEDTFGIYQNTVTAYPSEGDSFSDNESIDLQCDIEDEEETPVVPETGLFDSVLSKIILGIVMIMVGINWNNIHKLNYTVKEIVSDRRIRRFENRVSRK